MSSGLSLEQLRTFIAAADAGSFSAAGRKLGRAQSVVSEMIWSLEQQMGIALFERSGGSSHLTPQGRSMLFHARAVVAGADELAARAKALGEGLEAELAVAIDVLFPLTSLCRAARIFAQVYPSVPLRLKAELLGAALEPVVQRDCSLGIVGSLPKIPAGMVTERLTSIPMRMVAAAHHPLASQSGVIQSSELALHVQLVTTDRSELSEGQDFGVMSPRNWRLSDIFAKRVFLLDGLGFGGMPLHVVQEDLAAGRLVELIVEDQPVGGMFVPLSVIYPADAAPGPAGRRFIAALRESLDPTLPNVKSSPPL